MIIGQRLGCGAAPASGGGEIGLTGGGCAGMGSCTICAVAAVQQTKIDKSTTPQLEYCRVNMVYSIRIFNPLNSRACRVQINVRAQ